MTISGIEPVTFRVAVSRDIWDCRCGTETRLEDQSSTSGSELAWTQKGNVLCDCTLCIGLNWLRMGTSAALL